MTRSERELHFPTNVIFGFETSKPIIKTRLSYQYLDIKPSLNINFDKCLVVSGWGWEEESDHI